MHFCGGIKFCINRKGPILQFERKPPLSAHTPQALITGRYPLQSGLKTSDSTINPGLSPTQSKWVY